MIATPTINVPAGMWVGFIPICHKAAGDTFNCTLCLDPDKAIHQGNKGGVVTTLFEAGVEVIILLLLLSRFQALLWVLD